MIYIRPLLLLSNPIMGRETYSSFKNLKRRVNFSLEICTHARTHAHYTGNKFNRLLKIHEAQHPVLGELLMHL